MREPREQRLSVLCACGEVAGAAATFVNRTRTSFGEASSGRSPQRVLVVGGNCRL